MERLSIGNGGWVLWFSDQVGIPVWIRFGEDSGGRLVVLDVYLAGDGGSLEARVLRGIPLGRIATWANGPETRGSIKARLGGLSPDLRTLASYYATSFGTQGPNHWVKRSFAAQVPGSGEPQVPEGGAVKKATEWRARSAKLPVPRAIPYPDAFYRRVAEIFASGTSAPEIADTNRVPLTTVHRWLKESRRRGFLPPGRRKKD